MTKIFISYRREDTAAHVGRLYDELQRKFGRRSVFMDIDTIEPGQAFAEQVVKNINNASIVLVAIGKTWLKITDSNGQRRIDKPEDFVHLEILAALNSKKTVIPILFDGTPPLTETDLPDTLKPLAQLQALEISASRFRYDMDRLIKSIDSHFSKLKIMSLRHPTLMGVVTLTIVLLPPLFLIGEFWLKQPVKLPKPISAYSKTEGAATFEPATLSPNDTSVSQANNPFANLVIDVDTMKLKREIDRFGQISEIVRDSKESGRALGTIGAHFSSIQGSSQIYISSVVPNGAAFKSGLFAGDILLLIDGQKIENDSDALYAILGTKVGSIHVFTVNRGARELAFSVQIEELGKSDLQEFQAIINDRETQAKRRLESLR